MPRRPRSGTELPTAQEELNDVKGVRSVPSGSYYQADVMCPFYKYDDGRRRITCEGLVDDSSLALIYRKKGDFEQQIQTFCCRHYTRCEVYRILMDKYED